jgi:2-oxoglutarate/2-oxoacid ferredoxin oxidoreductase subunit beta
LSRLSGSDLHYTPVGIFRSVERPAYDDSMREQVEDATAAKDADLTGLLHGSDTWIVG